MESVEICLYKWITGMQKLQFVSSVFCLFSFSEDVPRDYRHVSLTGVKQRFEDEVFHQISKEKVRISVLILLNRSAKWVCFAACLLLVLAYA